MQYTLSIGRNGDNLTKVSQGRFHDEGEWGWVEFVDLGLLFYRESGYLRQHDCEVPCLYSYFGRMVLQGKVAAKLRGFEIDESVKPGAFVWHIANLSEILDDAIIFEKDGYVRGRLYCIVSNLDESDKNSAITYSFSLSVHGEVKLRDSKAPLCPNSTENDEVRLFEVTKIHQGCTVALTCQWLTLTSIVEKVFEHQLQKEKDEKNAISGTHEAGVSGSLTKPAQVPRDIDLCDPITPQVP
ncbi:hypothetical protein Vadar_024058 [Vaccinium darrowii]|uniref:Uncharacterized protein n=1 Tax=Vaccinium darrowii TaxID=229202 RepID=A0ACB7XBZ8_9ERIC|nr:hypothetical protein Vadar_024058 [Vaccinium darrowii]